MTKEATGFRKFFTSSGLAEEIQTLPVLPTDIIKWIKRARPIVEGGITRDMRITPFWMQVYEDKGDLMVMNGRQTYKSTYATDILACETTSKHGVAVGYITYDDSSRNGFSNQKLRVGTFLVNPLLHKFPRRGKSAGNVGEVSMNTNSTIYCMTDNYEYRHAEGKSLEIVVCDEAQYQDIQYIPKLHETMTATKGRLLVLGVGGEAGSPYERLWRTSSQMEWEYDDPYWREKLRYGLAELKEEEYFFPKTELIVGDYLNTVLKGRWVIPDGVADNPFFHGYHMPQQMFATIPLTIKDSLEKYKLKPRDSIEYKQRHNPHSIYQTHVLGTFYHAVRRPVTREMVERCMDYNYRLSTPDEIAEMKDSFGDLVKISMGVDFGSGPARSATVITILIEWKKSERYHLAFIEKRPAENQMDQAEYICKLFKQAKCDVGVGDLGYGANQMKAIQEGNFNRKTGEPFDGVGASVFVGSRMIGDETKPFMKYDKKIDEHGEITPKYTMDKTSEIQGFIDFLEVMISHPEHPNNSRYRRTKLLIPSSIEYETNWLIDDFTDITRRDLEKTDDVDVTEDRRIKAKKQFNHPKDSTMSVIYAKRGLESNTEWYWVSSS